jgi:hypothetical protein
LNSKFRINASVGDYYKIAPYTILGYKDANGVYVNKSNPYVKSRHYVAGVEYALSNSSRITLEGFYKQYSNYPVSVRNEISLANLGGNFGFVGNEGFGVFSYNKDQVSRVYNYILNQEEHHSKQTFKEEYFQFLKDFDIEYDERYLFREDLET